ncbi:hypothetical protein [uncultured Dokdonia sp.]|uniref:hypothetical protein n=1 Tax=uncultured Dokdonia sp. TaxID=575653 RepID=UPI002621A325|nr:hypothetical protein [uncultured Dokdonia sp.]
MDELNQTQCNPPFRLTQEAYDELVIILREEIGQDAIDNLGPDNIHHIGHHLLTLTATQLKIRIKEEKEKENL